MVCNGATKRPGEKGLLLIQNDPIFLGFLLHKYVLAVQKSVKICDKAPLMVHVYPEFRYTTNYVVKPRNCNNFSKTLRDLSRC